MTTFDLIRDLRDDSKARIVLLVADGLGGLPLTPDGKTELETAETPNLNECARVGTDCVRRRIHPVAAASA